MAAADEAWEPPLLSWKRMQSWSVGRRAPAFCEIFMGFKATKLSNLISPVNSQQRKKKKGKRRKTREGEDGGDVDDVSEVAPADETQHPRCSSLQLAGRLSRRSSLEDVPHRHSISFEPCGRISSQRKLNCDAAGSDLKRNSDATASNPKRNSDYMRRSSDASVSNLQRLCTASASPCGGYERVWVVEGRGDGGLDCVLPREVKLGGRRSDVSAHMGRQDSGMSAQRRSSCSSFSSSSSVASAASAVGRLASRRSSSASAESEQRHFSQLVAGNQFLTHLTAAPAPSSAMEHMRPSEGFLLDASVRCREAELRERIIFFL